MPTKIEKDAISGQHTTGHEWDGIKELNTPLPKWWVYTFYACILFAAVYVVLYPAIPGFSSHSKGILDWTRREALDAEMAEARARQAETLAAIDAASLDEIRNDPRLVAFATAGGRAAFAENCAPCHGGGGGGRPGFPILADDAWIWGGTLDDIYTDIRYGIRSSNPNARVIEMPAFGALGILSGDEIADVAQYVLSLSGRAEDAAAAARGEAVFDAQCVACHGEKGAGTPAIGAPRLSDHIWLYGDTAKSIMAR